MQYEGNEVTCEKHRLSYLYNYHSRQCNSIDFRVLHSFISLSQLPKYVLYKKLFGTFFLCASAEIMQVADGIRCNDHNEI